MCPAHGPVILTERMTKLYGDITAVDNLNLEVVEGEVFGFLGPNGAGKTTTCRILTTLTKPSSGRAFVSGFDVVTEPVKAKRGIGVVTQYQNLDGELTAYENLKLHGMLYGMEGKERKGRIAKLLQYVELEDRSSSRVSTFSGGMKRRLMIARALLHQPKVLFLDEPTVGLDAQTRRNIWALIRKINQEGATVFLTTHYIEEAEMLCDRVGIIDQGILIALDDPEQLLKVAGNIVVETLSDDGPRAKFFQNRDEASEFAASSNEDVIVRKSNLEDVFIQLTGRRVAD
ncbi:MAG: ATP-binding cassette domain-containing protein [Thermodesulfobacteriota bacterium]|nr:ATP-binding cassette domain-containing protein [Thermodesulfobacteriota bacterium]